MEKIKVDNKVINLNIKNKLTKIYGANGVGKTTISKHFAKENKRCFVFNEQYIYDNVYYTSGGSVKTIGEQKKNLGRVFISENYKILNANIQRVYDFKKNKKNKQDIKNLIKENINSFDKKYEKIIIDNLEHIEKKYLIWEKTFLNSKQKEVKNININEIINNLNLTFINKMVDNELLSAKDLQLNNQNLKSKYDIKKLELENSYIEYKMLIEDYNNFLTKNALLSFNKKSIFQKNIINLINEYNNILEQKKEYDKAIERIASIFKSLNLPEPDYNNPENELFEWIKKGHLIHANLSAVDKLCLYCGNQNLPNIWMKEFNLIFENKILKNTKEIMIQVNKLLNNYEKLYKFLNDHSGYNQVPEVKLLIEKLKIINNDSFKKIIFQKIINKELIILDDFLELLVEINKIEFKTLDTSNLSYYVLDVILSKIFENLFSSMQDKIFDLIINILNSNINIEISSIKKDITELFNELNEMQLDPFQYEIKFSLPKGNTLNREAELIIINKKNGKEIIETLSTGQRNNLALMYFVSQAKRKIENKEIDMVIIDDPVDGGDFYSYFLIKSFIMNYFMEKPVKIVILTHNFDYLLIQLAGTDRNKQGSNDKIINSIDIIKIMNDGSHLQISKEEINSDNKTIYFKLTEYIAENIITDPILIASWIIWTRKIIEEWLVDNIKLNSGMYIPDHESYKFISKELPINNIQIFLNDEYYEFINGKISYDDMIIKTKSILNLIFKNNQYLNSLVNLINNVSNKIISINNFDKELFLNLNVNTNNFLINLANKSAKLMIFEEETELKSKSKIIKDIAKYLKHSGNSVSRPIIALEVDSILERENK